MTDIEKYEAVIKHIRMVENNCCTLAKAIFSTDKEFALQLIQAGRKHDLSKFDLFEFDNLHSGMPAFDEALFIHRVGNKHHPESFKKGIHGMSDLNIAEMVCDITARAQEFGTDVRQWVEESATKKYDFSMDDKVGQLITKYLNLLLKKSF
jgi:hypothetical protein